MAHWQFRPLNPNEPSGSSIADDNFVDEERSSVEILVRETLQNPLDARANDETVRVEYHISTIDVQGSAFEKLVFTDDWEKHFFAGKILDSSSRPSQMSVLLIEDFGTTGLEGTYTDSSVEGNQENWNAFWFREGEGAKSTRSNGGAGQGKITLYLASKLRTVLALTKRRSDKRALLLGCCRFSRNYKLPNDDTRWAKEARWGATQNPDVLATPIEDPVVLDKLRTELGIRREIETGTTFIVPMPHSEITEAQIRNAVVNEFYFAIIRGRLVVTVGSEILNSSSISRIADEMGANCRLSKPYRRFLSAAADAANAPPVATAKPQWLKTNSLSNEDFNDSELDNLREMFEQSELVDVEFPVTVRPKSGSPENSSFRVFLQQDEHAEESIELYVRQDLGIDGERRLKSAGSIVPVMALTFINDSIISGLLVAAEEPTHRTWNSKRNKVVSLYKSPNDVLSAVRNGALRLVRLIAPAGERDETALSAFFADPNADESTKSKSGKGGRKKKDGDRTEIDVPQPKPKPVSISMRNTGFEVKANDSTPAQFPIQCTVTVAYATTSGDAFKQWDAADFWLGDELEFPRTVEHVSDISTKLNTISFALDNATSSIAVDGFSLSRQLEVRVRYKEAENGADS